VLKARQRGDLPHPDRRPARGGGQAAAGL